MSDSQTSRRGRRALSPRANLRSMAYVLLDGLLELAAGRELRHPRRGDVNPLGRIPRVHAHPRGAVLRRELPEAGEGDLFAASKRLGDRVEKRVDGFCGVPSVQAALRAQPVPRTPAWSRGSPPLDVLQTSCEDPNSDPVSAQPCGFAAVFRRPSSSPARKSGLSRTPWRASSSTPPSSRSTTQTAVRHSRPASRSASTAATAAPPEVTTSSTRHTRSPGSNTPSSRLPVP